MTIAVFHGHKQQQQQKNSWKQKKHLPQFKSTGSCCYHTDVGVCMGTGMGLGVPHKSFTIKFFYLMSKGLSDELSCMWTDLVMVPNYLIITPMYLNRDTY